MWSNFFQTLYKSGKDCSGLFWTLDVVTTDDPVTNFATFQTDRGGCHYLEKLTSSLFSIPTKKNAEICSRVPARDVRNKSSFVPYKVLQSLHRKNKYFFGRKKKELFFQNVRKLISFLLWSLFSAKIFGSLRPLRGHKIHEAHPGNAPAQRATRSSEGQEDLAKNKKLPVPVPGLEVGCGR